MVNELLEKFDNRLNHVNANDKFRFLHGVYKQLVPSARGKQTNGEYRIELEKLSSGKKDWFITNFASDLLDHGMVNHACKLLQEYNLTQTAQRLDYTLSEMDKIEYQVKQDSKIFVDWSGVHIDVGGYRRGNPFCASIILHDGSYGHQNGLFEIMPIFKGKSLDDAGFCTANVIGWLSLKSAFALASATLSKNESSVRRTLREVY